MVLHVSTLEGIAATGAEVFSAYSGGQVGTVGVGEVTFQREWAVACDDVGIRYYVHLPITGCFRSRYRGTDLPPGPRTTWVGHPGQGPFLGTWERGYRGLCVSIEQAAVEDALGRLLGGSVPVQVPFGPTMDIASGYGRGWAQLLFSARRQMADPGSLLSEPIVAAPLAEAVVNGFLLAVPHSHSGAIQAPAPAARPAAIRAAVDLIEADPAAPLTVSALAAHSGSASARCRTGSGSTWAFPRWATCARPGCAAPTMNCRLADPLAVSVAEVARRWGFGHPGRFAAMHHARYGQTPLTTLRG